MKNDIKPETKKALECSMDLREVDLDKIDQNENSRVVYKIADLQELMGSMKRDGLLQPVGVKEIGKGKYEAVYGNRRIVAARKLGWATIPCVVQDVKDDIDRDLLNMVENIKRQNISVSEEGRMYQSLMDRKLSIGEIAARLEIGKGRVETALDAVKHVPEDFKGKIVNRISGSKPKGTVSATAYQAIAQIRKNENLNRGQFRSLLDYAAKERVSTNHVAQIAPLLKQGMELPEALDKVDKYDRVTLFVYVPKSRRKKLEEKYKRSITDLMMTFLETSEELGAKRAVGTRTGQRRSPALKKYTVDRKGQ